MPIRTDRPVAPPPLRASDDAMHVKLKDGLTFGWSGPNAVASMHLEVPVKALSGFIGAGKDVAKAAQSAVLMPPLVSEPTEVPVQVKNGKLIIDATNINAAGLQLPVMASLKLDNGHMALLEVSTENVKRDSAGLKAQSLRENIPVLERVVANLTAQLEDYARALPFAKAGRELPADLAERTRLPTNIDGKVQPAAVKLAQRGTTAQLESSKRLLAQSQKELETIDKGDHRAYVDVGHGPGWRPR